MRWLKLAERVNLGSAKIVAKLQIIPIFNAERRWSQYQDPPRRLRLGLGDSPCCGGIVRCEMHAELCKIDQSVSTAFYLRRRLHGGVWGLYRPTLDPNLGIVATRPHSSTRCGRFRTHGRKCPQQCWRQRQCSWVESNYLGPGPSLERCGGRYRIFGVITISIPTGRTGHAERNSCAIELRNWKDGRFLLMDSWH